MVIVILCAGKSKRFEWEGISKHLLPVFGEQLLSRTIRQCADRGVSPHIVTHDLDMTMGLKERRFSLLEPMDSSYTCATLNSTFDLWDERVIVLLGDVLYSTALMDSIIHERGSIVFFGHNTKREIYALTFSDQENLLKGLYGVKGRVEAGFHGQLWQLFYVLHSIPPEKHPRTLPYRRFRQVWDFSRDFDTVEGYLEFIGMRV